MISSEKVATAFLIFEAVFFGFMMTFNYLAPLDFVSGVLELPNKNKLQSILIDNLDGGDAMTYATFTAVDLDNCHGMVVFMALIALHTALKVDDQERSYIFAIFFIAHCLVVMNQTKAINGNYYVNVDQDAATKIFGPARMLHSFFAMVHMTLAVVTTLASQGRKKGKNE